jgi:hypothetical protein
MNVDVFTWSLVKFFTMSSKLGKRKILRRWLGDWPHIGNFVWRLLIVICSVTTVLAMCGCGATSARLGVGPAIDSRGRVAIETTFTLGLGTPLDFKGRSQHYLQGLGFVGGSSDVDADVDSDGQGPTAGLGVDYLYWAHPRFDVRTGAYFVYRNRDERMKELDLYGLGAHLALLPVLTKKNSDVLVPQVCIGLDFRVDQAWDANSRLSRTQFAAPLVIEINLLAAGD